MYYMLIVSNIRKKCFQNVHTYWFSGYKFSILNYEINLHRLEGEQEKSTLAWISL